MVLAARGWRIPGLALAAGLLIALIGYTAWAGLLSPRAAVALDSEEQQFLALLNEYRVQNGVGPLIEHPALRDAALWMANDMATKNYFSHTDSFGRDPFQRMDQMGYAYNTWRGENLVAGTETAGYAFQLWKDSPSHNANMLGPNYTVIGIARVFGPASDYGWYWATEFGGVGAPTPAPPPPTQAPPPPPQPTPAPVVRTAAPAAPTVAPAPPPAPTIVATPQPTPSPEPTYKQTEWWQTLEAVTDDWGAKIFAWQLLRISPPLEELFVAMMRRG